MTPIQSSRPGTLAICVVTMIHLSMGIAITRAEVAVIAHRGNSRFAPENTIGAIDSAADSADLTEFDVQVAADGELVLMHDDTVDRTTDGTGPVDSLTLSELQALDAGSWFSPEFSSETVPTLAQAIRASQANNLTPIVEQKTGLPNAYHSSFQSLGISSDEFQIISFDWRFLGFMDRLDSNYQLGALGSGELTQNQIDRAISLGADFIDWSHSDVSQETVDLVHQSGMELYVYTVNDVDRMQELIDFGIDGITTDDPALLRTLVPEPSSAPLMIFMFVAGAALARRYYRLRGQRIGPSK